MQVLLLLSFAVPLLSGESSDWQDVPLDLPEWETAARVSVIEEHLGRTALKLQGGKRWLQDLEFKDGEIAFDVAFSPARGFAGLAWHAEDSANYEYFYVRPHQSGNPDACQYTPVHHGVAAWQLFQGPGYSAVLEHRFDEWITIRIVIAGTRAEIYVDSEEPVVVIPQLHRGGVAGGIGLVAADFAPVHFSRFRFRVDENPPLESTVPPEPNLPPGTVTSFSISSAFDEALLAERTNLEGFVPAQTGDATAWTQLATEASGIANLARVQGIAPGADTAFAWVRLQAEEDEVVPLSFGYSDRVRVFLNGSLLYTGDNGYKSRDYRYLGTLGRFDSVPLRLQRGANELVFAVSESFGGWGLTAVVEPRDGVRVVE